MHYYAVIDREVILTSELKALSEGDLSIIGQSCPVVERVVEESNGITAIYLGTKEGLPEGYEAVPMRTRFAVQDEQETWLMARAKALLSWRMNTRYCGRCGHALEDSKEFTARVCPECGNLIFPRIEPCIIVLVSRSDGKILLAKHVQRNQNIYACIAGFMEAGETAEQAVAREILEETGLHVTDIRYFGSQSWPFPAQLMLGFTARYESGDIHLQAEELCDAQWFDRDDCPASPPPGSIAWRLIHEREK